jgi:hypothetical protein
MSDKSYKQPLTEPSSPPSRKSWQDTWNPHDRDSLRDSFIQKHEPELSIPYDRNWQDSLHNQE